MIVYELFFDFFLHDNFERNNENYVLLRLLACDPTVTVPIPMLAVFGVVWHVSFCFSFCLVKSPAFGVFPGVLVLLTLS